MSTAGQFFESASDTTRSRSSTSLQEKRDCFEANLKQAGRALKATITRRLNGRQDGSDEDVAQEAAVAAWDSYAKRREDDGPIENFTPWICKIGENKASDWRRKEIRQKTSRFTDLERTDNGERIEFDVPETDVRVQRWTLKQTVGALVGQLPEEQQTLIRLRYEQELTFEEIAQQTGYRTVDAAKKALSRVQKALRESLKTKPGPTS